MKTILKSTYIKLDTTARFSSEYFIKGFATYIPLYIKILNVLLIICIRENPVTGWYWVLKLYMNNCITNLVPSSEMHTWFMPSWNGSFFSAVYHSYLTTPVSPHPSPPLSGFFYHIYLQFFFIYRTRQVSTRHRQF